MANFCPRCGSAVASNDAGFCFSCGLSLDSLTRRIAPPISTIIDLPSGQSWYVSSTTGIPSGPYTEEEVSSLITARRILIGDSVAPVGGQVWTPIAQSRFASQALMQANVNRLMASTCPRCGAGLVTVTRRSGVSWAFIALGLITIWLFGVGLIFLIIGFLAGRTPSAVLQCPNCKFRAS
jgi:hypothetical protein